MAAAPAVLVVAVELLATVFLAMDFMCSVVGLGLVATTLLGVTVMVALLVVDDTLHNIQK